METPATKLSSVRSLHPHAVQPSNSIRGEEPPRLIVDTTKEANVTPKSMVAMPPPYSSVNSTADLLIVFSPSPTKTTRSRLIDRFDMADESAVHSHGRRRFSKGKSIQPCASPRNASRRVRRRGEMLESREELIGAIIEEIEKMNKRKRPSKKEKIASVASSSPNDVAGAAAYDINLDSIGSAMHDLIMWKDAAKTSLWFGLGSLFFFSSCFTKEINYSVCSAISQLGILFLATSFLSNTVSPRNRTHNPARFNMEEGDLVKAVKWIFPLANLAVSKTREIFSGEPAMTLKVFPLLVAGAEYGHILTVRRLAMAGFFVAFTLPKLCSSYAISITQAGECMKGKVLETWAACSRKKVIAISIVMAFWNISSIKTRVFAGFLCLVILRCFRANLLPVQDCKNSMKEDQTVPDSSDATNEQQKIQDDSHITLEPRTNAET